MDTWLLSSSPFLIYFQVIEEDGTQALSERVGGVFIRELMKLRDEFEVVGDVRGKGLMLGMEFVKDKVCVGKKNKVGGGNKWNPLRTR